MSTFSALVITKSPSNFQEFISYVQGEGWGAISVNGIDELNNTDLETFFNPVVLIDVHDFEKGEISKLVDKAKQQHMPFFFVLQNADLKTFEDYKLYLPTGYFTSPMSTVSSVINIEQSLHNASSAVAKSQKLEELFVKNGKDYLRIGSDEILWIQASGNYIEIFTSNDRSYLLRVGLKEIELRLPDDQFIRVHKSYIVNKKHILKFNSNSLRTQQGEVPIARSYFNAVLTSFTII
ncbi:MAG: LytTR family transcriptional regulator [Bacteroidia bacterium]